LDSLMARQIKWLGAQCECEELDGAGLCPACGIASALLNTHDNARLMQTMTGEWVWAAAVLDVTSRDGDAGETPAPPVPVGICCSHEVELEAEKLRHAATRESLDGCTAKVAQLAATLRSPSPEPPAPESREALVDRALTVANKAVIAWSLSSLSEQAAAEVVRLHQEIAAIRAALRAALHAPAEAAPACPPLKVGDAVSYRDEVDSVVVKIEQSGTLPNGEHYESYAVTEDKAVVVPSDIVRLERDGVLIWEDTTP
jgi:hypothetical protein